MNTSAFKNMEPTGAAEVRQEWYSFMIKKGAEYKRLGHSEQYSAQLARVDYIEIIGKRLGRYEFLLEIEKNEGADCSEVETIVKTLETVYSEVSEAICTYSGPMV